MSMTDQIADFPLIKEISDSIAAKFADSVLETKFEKGDLSVKVKKQDIIPVLNFLKHDKGFKSLDDIIALDNLNTEGAPRFTLLYQLYRFADFQRVRIVIDVPENVDAESIYSVYKSSDWAEREIFDMFGVKFTGHPNLRRIYMPDDFSGFPLRKDFPLEG
jgi:NADH-quinone oxidoreductase subunit C